MGNGTRTKFLDNRMNVVRVMWPNGGSPDAVAIWEAADGISPARVKGRCLLVALKTIAKDAGQVGSRQYAFVIPSGSTVAPELKAMNDEAAASNAAAK